MRLTLIVLLCAATALSACGSDVPTSTDALRIVATTGVAADLARAVGGTDIEVTTLIPAGADPHAYEPRPRDLKALTVAKLVVRSGGELDEWLDGAIESAGAEDLTTVTLLEAAAGGATIAPADAGNTAGHAGDVDAHWWHDPRAAIRAVEAVGRALAKANPARAAAVRRRAAAEVTRLRELDAAIERCVTTIPKRSRKLVTSHDALGPYARRYGLEVIGAVIPSRSTQARPSTRSVDRLIETIRRERVPAVFAETSVNPKVERAIAEAAGARVGGTLYADGLGEPGSPGETYVGALKANTRTIVDGLGGDVAGCALP